MNNNSTWYVDGYRDGAAGEPRAVLEPLKSRVYGECDINQIEYNEGYEAGKAVARSMHHAVEG